ncbi:CoA-transferase family III [Stachybotrys elegans]|uniref:CoA-transferase family III n=1 Tax=Stachybotrys elegans TaxID=80388 RepID=A0A8K0WXJ1_9HYPO|nr:CoA-transferase family III [Stachybotrys elegans]
MTDGERSSRGSSQHGYSVENGASDALVRLLGMCRDTLPEEYLGFQSGVSFTTSPGFADDVPLFPCPLKEQEATAAIRALEGMVASTIAQLRYGCDARDSQIRVDVTKAACSLMSSYMTTLDDLTKSDPEIRNRIPDTDLNGAQSILYRRLSANLYRTKDPASYYHIHGSLEATKTLQMLGLEPFRPDLQDYRECLRTIGTAVRQFTVRQLEEMNAKEDQAGVPALRHSEFLQTCHGKALDRMPAFTVHAKESATPAVPFLEAEHTAAAAAGSPPRQALTGIRVLELCRVVAGPTIGRSLAAHGASVLKVTSPHLPDVPFFQLDVNTGKHTTSLHLRDPQDRAVFEELLATTDVVIDGYRPGALEGLGYGPDSLVQLARRRGRGIVYVAEDCFGGSGLDESAGAEWASRRGWQQIADCVTGVAWEQGRFMRLDEPIVPPFPMSDYGTGALGCVAALTGLYRRATQGGSWVCRTSLCQYNLFVLSLGLYPGDVQDRLRRAHDRAFFDLRHDDSVDEVSQRALQSLKRVHARLFAPEMVQQAWSRGFGGRMTWPREALAVQGLRVGHARAARPNGFDEPSWENWEVEEEVVRQ